MGNAHILAKFFEGSTELWSSVCTYRQRDAIRPEPRGHVVDDVSGCCVMETGNKGVPAESVDYNQVVRAVGLVEISAYLVHGEVCRGMNERFTWLAWSKFLAQFTLLYLLFDLLFESWPEEHRPS